MEELIASSILGANQAAFNVIRYMRRRHDLQRVVACSTVDQSIDVIQFVTDFVLYHLDGAGDNLQTHLARVFANARNANPVLGNPLPQILANSTIPVDVAPCG